MTEIKSNVFYCTICQFPEEALPNAYRVRPYVNEIIIVHNQPVIAQVKAEFDELGAILHWVDWKEDFSYKRTQYIRKTGELIKEKGSINGYTKNNTWMLISDTDEFPSIALLQNLQHLIAKAEIEKSTICTINAHDYFIKGEGTSNPFTFIARPLEEIDKNEITLQKVSNYYKELLVKYQDKLEYTGKVHHTLRGSGLRMMQASKNYYYDHIKTDADLHSHGCRNWFIGGGGVQEFSKKWKEFHKITDKYGLVTWENMEKSMKIGNLHVDILQFIVDHKDDNDSGTDSELRSFYSYYKILHENELKNVVQNIKTVITETGIKSPVPNSKEQEKDKDELYYDPNWKKYYDKPLINTSKPLYKYRKSITGDYINDMSYHFQEVKVSSDSSDSTNYSDDEIRIFVEDSYNKILGRCGDPDGVKSYNNLIKSGRLKKENLADIFRKSDEYIEKGLKT